MDEAFNEASRIAGRGEGSLERILLGDQRRLDLAVRALDAAGASTFDQRVRAFAATIARAAIAPSEVELDRIGLVIRSLETLDHLHIRVLAIIAREDNITGLSPADLEVQMEIPSMELRSVVRVLELHGLIVDDGRFEAQPAIVRWRATEVGDMCLRLIRDGQRASGAEDNGRE